MDLIQLTLNGKTFDRYYDEDEREVHSRLYYRTTSEEDDETHMQDVQIAVLRVKAKHNTSSVTKYHTIDIPSNITWEEAFKLLALAIDLPALLEVDRNAIIGLITDNIGAKDV